MQVFLAKLMLVLDGAWRGVPAHLSAVRWTLAPWAGPLLVAGALGALVLAALCYRRTTEGLTWRNRVFLGGLRFVALVCLLVMISGVICTVRVAQSARPQLLLVVDNSPSMTLRMSGGTRLQAAEDALGPGGLRARLATDFDVREVYTSAARRGSGADSADAPQDLARALVRLANAAPSPPDHILLVSDGVQTMPEPLAAAAAELPAPVSALAVGDPAEVRDVILQGVSVPAYAYVKDRTQIGATVHAFGGLTGEATLKLYQVRGGGEKELATGRVTLRPDGRPAIARLEFQADTAGRQSYAVRVVPLPGELTDRNNSLQFQLDVRQERIRVLFVEGEPSWEYRFTKEALERDPAVQFHGLVRLPDGDWFYQGPDKRADGKPVLRAPKKGFPMPGDEWNYFDVMILGDLERKEFERGDGFALVDAFVRQRGGGLITIGGMKVYGAGDYEGTPLARLVPFDVVREKKQELINRFQVQVTPEGLMHPVTQLELDPTANAKAWQGLPWVEGGNAIGGVKPGATCLLVHPTLQTKLGPRPVAAAWQTGAGRVFSSALDGTWHWRLAAPTDTDYHQRFWGLAVRWVAGDLRRRQPLGVLTAEEASIEVGRPAHFSVMVQDGEGHALLDATVEYTIGAAGESGGALLVRAAADPAVPGRYAVAFVPERAGDLPVRVVVTTAAGQTQTQESVFSVAPSRAEFLRVLPAPEALRVLAAAGHGRFALLAMHASLSLPPGAARVEERVFAVDARSAPGLILVLAVCLFTEWFMRKRRGLA